MNFFKHIFIIMFFGTTFFVSNQSVLANCCKKPKTAFDTGTPPCSHCPNKLLTCHDGSGQIFVDATDKTVKGTTAVDIKALKEGRCPNPACAYTIPGVNEPQSHLQIDHICKSDKCLADTGTIECP